MTRAPAKTTRTKPAPAAPPVANETLLGSSTFAATLDVGGRAVQLGEIVAAAHARSGLAVEAWNALDEARRDQLLNAELEIVRSTAAAQSEPDAPGVKRVPSPKEVAGVAMNRELHRIDELFQTGDRDGALMAIATHLQEIADARLAMGEAELMLRAKRKTIVGDESPAPDLSGVVTVTVIGPARGLRRAGFNFGAAPQAVTVDRAQLAAIEADPALSVTRGGHSTSAIAGPAERLPIEAFLDAKGKPLAVRVLGPQKGRRRGGFNFGPEAQVVTPTLEQLRQIHADADLALMPEGTPAAV